MLAFLFGILATLAVLAVGAVAVAYSGAYEIAATEDHASAVRWALQTNFHNAVENGAEAIPVPAEITPAMLASGAAKYKEACQHCHGGPGVKRSEWASGMRPLPPHLVEAASEWEPSEIFVIVKNGVRMTGMPAFGPTHDDETLWGVAAFVSDLPAMTPEEYAASGGEDAGHGGPGGDGGHGGGEAGDGASTGPAPAPPAAERAQ